MQDICNEKKRHFVDVPATGLSYPETVIYGASPGKHVTVSAGVHSREYVGIEAVRRLAESINPADICGELHLIHAFNYDGFIRRSCDVFPADGKNLNREFPGKADGSPTQRFAARLESQVIGVSDYIIDLHSGGGYEQLIPHVYFQHAASPEVCAQSQELARCVDVDYIVRSRATNGFYGYAGLCGVPGIIIERGQYGLWDEGEVGREIRDVENILRFLGVLDDGIPYTRRYPRLISTGHYEDAPVSGCWYPRLRAGDTVHAGEKLGEIRDIFGRLLFEYFSKADGILLYQTASLGIEAGSPMLAYGETDGNEWY